MIYGFIPFGFCGKISTWKFVLSPAPVEIFIYFILLFSLSNIVYIFCVHNNSQHATNEKMIKTDKERQRKSVLF